MNDRLQQAKVALREEVARTDERMKIAAGPVYYDIEGVILNDFATGVRIKFDSHTHVFMEKDHFKRFAKDLADLANKLK